MCSKTVLLLRTKIDGWMAHLQRSKEGEKKKEIYVAGRMKNKKKTELGRL